MIICQMSRTPAKFLSYTLHPLLMPFYAILMVLNLNTYIAFSLSGHVQQVVLSLVFITTVALPVITAVFLIQKGVVRNLEMETIAERRLPFITTAIFYVLCYFLLLQMPLPRMIPLMVLGAFLAIFIAWLISFSWKISIHMIGIGGLTGLLIALSDLLNAGLVIPVILTVMIAGFLGSARLSLRAHTPPQIYSGYIVGLLCEWIVISNGV